MAPMRRLRGRFEDYQAFEAGLTALRDHRHALYEAYGPSNLAELEDLMPRQGSAVRISATAWAVIGLGFFFFLCVLTSMIYALVVGGKPPVSRIPYVIVAYEGTILLGALGTIAAVLILAKLGLHEPPADHDRRVTGDSFAIELTCPQKQCEQFTQLLKGAGAVEVVEL